MSRNLRLNFVVLCALFLSSGIHIFAQKLPAVFYEKLQIIRSYNFESAEELLDTTFLPNPWQQAFFKQQFHAFVDGKNQAYSVAKNQFDHLETSGTADKYFKEIILGDLALNDAQPHDSIGFDHLLRAKRYADTLQNDTLKAEALKRLMWYLFKVEKNRPLYGKFVSEYKAITYDKYESLHALLDELGYKMTLKFYDQPDAEPPLGLAKSGILMSQTLDVPYLQARFCQLAGVIYDLFLLDEEKALEKYRKAIKIYESIPQFYAQSHLFGMYINLGSTYLENNPSEGLIYLRKALQLPNENRRKKDLILLYDNLYRAHKINHRSDSAIYFLELRAEVQKNLDLELSAVAVNEIQTKYETEKKERENLELKHQNTNLEQEKTLNRNLFLAAFSSLAALGIISFLGYKNLKRKQTLVQKEKELELQKAEKLMQDRELEGIDNMIQAQEEERRRLANELHDNLGSLLATLKLNFQHLASQIPKKNNLTDLVGHTEGLLDETYSKVRLLAHAKNSGVIADRGLLVAVNKLAADISKSQQLIVKVENFGLVNRLENTIEILLFRIIQELMTNIIKYADARQAVIYLTQHEDHLNLIVEDNGHGFDTRNMRSKEGMGLVSISQRLERLNGSLEIDSNPGQGTSVIINLPLS